MLVSPLPQVSASRGRSFSDLISGLHRADVNSELQCQFLPYHPV